MTSQVGESGSYHLISLKTMSNLIVDNPIGPCKKGAHLCQVKVGAAVG